MTIVITMKRSPHDAAIADIRRLVEDDIVRLTAAVRAIAHCPLTGVEYGDWVQATAEDALEGRWPECHSCGTAVHEGPCVE